MPTEPNQNFIPRDIDNVEVKKVLELFSSNIEETVNFGSHVFNWTFSSIPGGDENIPIFLSFRHIFELIDSISVLVKHSCIEPCKILLRSVFESMLTIEYILEKNIKQRGMDFRVHDIHRELKIYRKWDKEDPLYKDFMKKIEKDEILKNWKPEFPQDIIKKEIAVKEEILSLPSYVESEKEYRRLKRKSKKAPKWWFCLHDGPRSLEELASKLNVPAMYEILYRQWSAVAHGIDIKREKIEMDEKGRVYVNQLRLPTDAQLITLLAISFAIRIIRKFINHFIPEKLDGAQKWYINEIQDFFMSLPERKYIVVK
jgi:hypothetical protein